MRVEKDEVIVEIKEETKLAQEDGTVIVLEAGDKIKVLEKEVEEVVEDK